MTAPSNAPDKPDGFAYRYHDGIRFETAGRSINGSYPIETIPYFFGQPAAEKARLSDREIMEDWERHRLQGEVSDTPFLRVLVGFARDMMTRTAAADAGSFSLPGVTINGRPADASAQGNTVKIKLPGSHAGADAGALPAITDEMRFKFIADFDTFRWEVKEDEGKMHWQYSLFSDYGATEWEDDVRKLIDMQIASLSPEDFTKLMGAPRPTAAKADDFADLRKLAEGVPEHIRLKGWFVEAPAFGQQYVYADDFRGMGRQHIASLPAGKGYFGTLAGFIAAASPAVVLQLIDAAALARPAAKGAGDLSQLVVGTQVEDGILTVAVHLKRGDHTAVLYIRNHALNGGTMGVQPLPDGLVADRATVSGAVALSDWPEEPTPEMQQAGAGAIRFDTTIINKLWTANAVYRAMRAALKGGA